MLYLLLICLNKQVEDVLLQSFDPASLLKLYRLSEYRLGLLIFCTSYRESKFKWPVYKTYYYEKILYLKRYKQTENLSIH